ncbi:ATP-dependent helicase NAM7 [Talaromyces islandicus]|uniref:ATP-dependent helicase NAM7 n=1 Tax=Talaromyces islandicus TaxID=28573 RepID=A0A0U1M985_TALIS|nr:ATP-dependent helicase NAM7 [Talaromyces islandicus]
MHVQRLTGVDHRIVLLPYPQKDLFLGAVTFGKVCNDATPSSVVYQSPMIPDGTPCTVVVAHHSASGKRRLKLRGVTAPRGIDISVSYDLVVLLSPTGDTARYLTFGIERKFSCKLKFHISEENVKAQIKAINTLRTEEFSRWHPILLNSDYVALPSVNVFEIPLNEVKAECRKVLKMRRWNKEQAEVFELLRKVPGNGFAFIEGIFGCGKTLVQAALAKLITALGLQVFIVAPTSAALQAVSQVLSEVAPELRTARIVFSGAEALKNYEVQETDTLDPEIAIMSHHIDNLVSTCLSQGAGLQFTYRETLQSDLEEYCAVAEYVRLKDENFSALPRESKDKTSSESIKKERAIFRKALATLKSTVVSGLQVLLCTNQLAASDLVRQNFGVETKGIVIIADEDGQTLEPTAWLPITLLRHADDIKAILRFGDRHQLPPLAIPAFSNFSEFAPQINRSLFDRHLRQHPPAVSLNTQYRMIPDLSAFPNSYTYQDRLRDGSSCRSITLDPLFEERFVEWPKGRLPKDAMLRNDIVRRVGITVSGSVVHSDPVSCSRSNKQHVKAVRDLLMTVFKEAPYPEALIAIIVPYNAQRALYFAVIKDLKLLTKLPYAKLPRVSTVDSMQGHESDIVLLDWVCGEADGLGFLKDDRRINVGLTRARSSLIVLYNDACIEASIRYDGLQRKKRAHVSQVVEHWTELKRSPRVLELEYENDATPESASGSAVETGTLGDEAGSEGWIAESGAWERAGFVKHLPIFE